MVKQAAQKTQGVSNTNSRMPTEVVNNLIEDSESLGWEMY